MKSPFSPLRNWARRTFLALKTMEKAMDYRFEDYAQERLQGLERRVAALEDGQAEPGALPPNCS